MQGRKFHQYTVFKLKKAAIEMLLIKHSTPFWQCIISKRIGINRQLIINKDAFYHVHPSLQNVDMPPTAHKHKSCWGPRVRTRKNLAVKSYVAWTLMKYFTKSTPGAALEAYKTS